MSRTPVNIRTNTTGTSPTRPLDHTPNPFSQVNQLEEGFSGSTSNLETIPTNAGRHISSNQDNLNMNLGETSHTVNERTSNIGRTLGSDESL